MPYLRLTAAVLCSLAFALPVTGAETTSSIPNFTGTWQHPVFPWFEPAASGPQPVTNLSRWPQFSSADVGAPSSKEGVSDYNELVGNYKNPILQPWAAEVVKKFGESSRAGITFPNPSNQCQPMPVPFVFKNFVLMILQEKDLITFLYANPQHDIRRIRLNASHRKPLKPSWYGDSIGHYEGDTLVVDTVGFTTDTALAGFGVRHSDKMHIVERMHVIEGDKLQIETTITDPEALAKPLTSTRLYGRHRDWTLAEYVCQQNNRNYTTDDGKAGINLKH